MTILLTQNLGKIRGRDGSNVTQFLGIKYATLKDRLADAQLIEIREGDVLDATTDGPTALSPPFGCDLEQSIIQHTLPKKPPPSSDTDCLNLNIAVPNDTTTDSRLPVFVFIHGGGLFIGANSWPQFDLERLVELSAAKGLPIVAVAINYRLGVFGFTTSKELRDAGYKANNGLRDQRVALEWVRRHIGDFGGDPDNITLAGMSAGAASVACHLEAETPLFRRAIMMSGNRFFSPSLAYEAHEERYEQIMAALGLTDASLEQRLSVLLNTPGEELVAKVPPSIAPAFALDGDLVPTAITYAQLGDRTNRVPRGKDWCRDIMVGDAQIDANIIHVLKSHLKQACAERFLHALATVLAAQPEVAGQIAADYGIRTDSDDDEAFLAILEFLNDVWMFAPTLVAAQGWKGRAFVYYFNEGNPWNGAWKGRAGHILDLAYLFQNFREFMSPAQQKVGRAIAEDFSKFCHGIKPWPAVADGDLEAGFTARVYGPSSAEPPCQKISRPFGGKSQRRSTIFDLPATVSLDDLSRVATMFMTVS
ncbi:putative carboxylesterase [Aspergillus saccharolyticus JOP 1030-1]|uniref:Carboxylic ester hydrolase n=1 Tax=Aspergillus saccharolyticus JOP 1030-1 TaxID=1450539 RepID=A0A318ZC95_9EURO|nr:putative carboxylesterase [Aspergillus saccharolyticus JOP 1030-1]PYH42313.1 putative carboxylesterase [Aspergillus saccharolyticus JOP 1030-1]